MRGVFCGALGLWGGACDGLVFEAITTGASDTAPIENNLPAETEDIRLPDIPKRIEECTSNSFEHLVEKSLEAYTVGNGSRNSCDAAALRQIVAHVNTAGKGKITFDCGESSKKIQLNGPIEIDEGVKIHIDGEHKIILTGNSASSIATLGEHSDVIFERLVFMRGKGNEKVNGNGAAVSFKNESLGGSLVFSECIFMDNRADGGQGGAVYTERVKELHLVQCVFFKNLAASGGGIYFNGKSLIVSDSVFQENQANIDGAAANIIQMPFDDNERTMHFCGTKFIGNQSAGNGSAMMLDIEYSSTASFSQCEFIKNESLSKNSFSHMGALHHIGGKLELESVSFVGNKSANGVAGLYMTTNTGFDATNCTFSANVSDEGDAGAIYQSDSNAGRIWNCTFLSNEAEGAGAIFRKDPHDLTITNSVFQNNVAQGQSAQHCNDTFSGQNNFQWSGGFSIQNNAVLCTPEEGIKLKHPFLEPSTYSGTNDEFVMTSSFDKLSPLIDATRDCPAFDARGVRRSWPRCDVGAYELSTP